MHRTLGHQPIGRKFFRNHLNFHHTYYCDDHLVGTKETIHRSSLFQCA
jgi:hypothetical protein